MKNLIYLSALFFVIVFISSCAPCPDCPEADDDDYGYTVQLKDTISKAKYDLWVSNWISGGQLYIADTLTQYFTLPIIDLDEFLARPGMGPDTIAAARFVIGLEVTSSYQTPHIMLVGVNASGQSMTDASRGQFIYDVSKPCPNLCDANSLPAKN